MLKTKTNKQFMILSVIAITVVVSCHLAGEFYRFFSIFPFICIFVFISGYFYNEHSEENLGKYIFYKLKKLIIPFFAINLIYGVITNILKYKGIISFGENITLYTLLVQPWIDNNQYVLNFPMYFVPALFITNCCYAVIHKISKKIKILNDITLFAIFILFQIISVYMQDIVREYNIIIIIARTMFFLPVFQFGYLYKQRWQEKEEKIPTTIYLIILFCINFVMYKLCGKIDYDMHQFSGFNQISIISIFASYTSILFFTRISKILSKYVGENRIINEIGNNTFSIMSHHLFMLFLLNFVLYEIHTNIHNIPYFDVSHFKLGWIYIYEIPKYNVILQLGYLIIGIFGPLLIHRIYIKIKEKIRE